MLNSVTPEVMIASWQQSKLDKFGPELFMKKDRTTGLNIGDLRISCNGGGKRPLVRNTGVTGNDAGEVKPRERFAMTD